MTIRTAGSAASDPLPTLALRTFSSRTNCCSLRRLITANEYSVNVYGHRPSKAEFFAHCRISIHPSTVDVCFDHDGSGVCGGIKDEDGDWNVAGHRDRIIEVDEETLALFARLYDDPGTPALEARLPSLHARELVGVLRKFADYPKRLGDLEGQYDSTEMWHETNAVDDGTIRRETRFPASTGEWILSGPHIYVANPLFKTPAAYVHRRRPLRSAGPDDASGRLPAAHQLRPRLRRRYYTSPAPPRPLG